MSIFGGGAHINRMAVFGLFFIVLYSVVIAGVYSVINSTTFTGPSWSHEDIYYSLGLNLELWEVQNITYNTGKTYYNNNWTVDNNYERAIDWKSDGTDFNTN